MRYICQNCNYRFESQQIDRKQRGCPYCGKKQVRDEPDADELLSVDD